MHETITFHHCCHHTCTHKEPLTTTCITHVRKGGGPKGPWACMDVLPDRANYWSEYGFIASSNAGHSCYNYIQHDTSTNCLAKLPTFQNGSSHQPDMQNFTHYCHFPCPINFLAVCCHHFLFRDGGASSSSSWLQVMNNTHEYQHQLH